MAFFNDVNPGGLDRRESEYLIKIGFDPNIINEYECFLDFSDFLLVRDLLETGQGVLLTSPDTQEGAEALLGLIKAVNRGSTCTEIAQETGVSKQAVSEGLKRAEKALLNYEDKLGLAARWKREHGI